MERPPDDDFRQKLAEALAGVQQSLVSEVQQLFARQLGEAATRVIAELHDQSIAHPRLGLEGSSTFSRIVGGSGGFGPATPIQHCAARSEQFPVLDQEPAVADATAGSGARAGAPASISEFTPSEPPSKLSSKTSWLHAAGKAASTTDVAATESSRRQAGPGARPGLKRAATSGSLGDVSRGRPVGSMSSNFSRTSIQKLGLLPLWELERTEDKLRKHRISGMYDVFGSFNSSMGGKAGDFLSDDHVCKCVVPPHSGRLACWDVWTTIVIVHDLVIIPLELFAITYTPSLQVSSFIVSLTWMFDLVLSFFRGYTDNTKGVVELRFRYVAQRYIRSWFPLDFLLVLIDLLIMLQGLGIRWLNYIFVLRGLRILRVMRMFRLVKISRRFLKRKAVKDMLKVNDASLHAEKNAAIFGSLQQLLCLSVVLHFIASGWYGIGWYVSGDTWVTRHFESSDSLAYRYSTSFHWSITQFTPASMEVHATTSIERTYTIICIFCGLVMFSSFVSSMTQNMARLRELSKVERQQSQSVRRYMTENHVSIELASSIMRFLKCHRASQTVKRLREQDIQMLSQLPCSLRGQLHEEVYSHILVAHALFAQLKSAKVQDALFSQLCQRAMREQCWTKGEEVFHVGQRCESMYFCILGRFTYFHSDDYPHNVPPSSWVAEAVLWTDWEHRGALIGQAQSSSVLLLDASMFHQFASVSHHHSELRSYAVMWVGRSSRSCGGCDYVTDIWGGHAEVNKMALRAFGGADPESRGVKKALLALDGGEHTLQVTFNAWRDVKYMPRRRWLCLPCLGRSQTPLHRQVKRNIAKSIKSTQSRLNLPG